jgi:hypothetical protein
MAMTMRVEIFSDVLEALVDFSSRVLRFNLDRDEGGGPWRKACRSDLGGLTDFRSSTRPAATCASPADRAAGRPRGDSQRTATRHGRFLASR